MRGEDPEEGVVAVLLDLSKCYERVNLELLVRRTVEAGWPPGIVVMAVGQYAAMRWVSVAGATVPGGRATCGMTPGCTCAVQFLADFLRPTIMAEIPRVIRWGKAKSKVYDLCR